MSKMPLQNPLPRKSQTSSSSPTSSSPFNLHPTSVHLHIEKEEGHRILEQHSRIHPRENGICPEDIQVDSQHPIPRFQEKGSVYESEEMSLSYKGRGKTCRRGFGQDRRSCSQEVPGPTRSWVYSPSAPPSQLLLHKLCGAGHQSLRLAKERNWKNPGKVIRKRMDRFCGRNDIIDKKASRQLHKEPQVSVNVLRDNRIKAMEQMKINLTD